MTWNKGSGKGPWGNRPTGGGGSSGGNGGGSGGNSGGGNTPPPDLEELLRKSQESLRQMMGPNTGGAKPLIIGLVGVFVLWLFSGIYRVDADEVGIVLRFGEYHRRTEPGLNIAFPYPIETVATPRVTSINREEIGFRSTGGRFGDTENRRAVPEESLMLTGDKNLVSAQFEVQWRIKDAARFLFNTQNPQFIVKPVAETAMREVMGSMPLNKALSDKRQPIAEATKLLMQAILDDYKTGIEIYEVNLLAVDAPQPVVDAFIDVLAAQQEKETLQNQALKYRDGIIPVAQGQVEKMIKDAEAYKSAVVAKAGGEASRFKAVHEEYRLAKDVTRRRIYLETMEEIMAGMNKLVLDKSAGQGVLPYLPLNELKPAAGAASADEQKGQ